MDRKDGAPKTLNPQKDFGLLGQEVMPHFHNTDIPAIHRLPLEILIKIFDLSVKPDLLLTESRLQGLQSISTVSRFWKDIIDNTASIWTRIAINPADHPKLITKALKISSPSALDITLNTTPSFDLSSLLLPHIGRIRSFCLRADSAKIWRRFLRTPAPLMEVVVIDVMYDAEPTSTPEAIFAGMATRLRTVHLGHIRMNIGRPGGLRELQFTGGSTYGPTLQDIVFILRSSPDLERLVLDETALGGGMAGPMDDQTIRLPHLKRLFLRWPHRQAAEYLLNLIDAPNLISFDYTESTRDITSASPSVANMVLRQARKALDPVSNLPGYVMIHVCHGRSPFWCMVERSREEIGGYPEAFELVLAIYPAKVGVLMRPIVDVVLSHLRNVEVTVELAQKSYGEDDDEYDPLAMLSTIPHIYKLSLHDLRYTSSIIQWLGERGSDGSWPCPRLKKLTVKIHPSEFLHEVLVMVKNRYGGQEAPIPMEMLSIVVDDYSRETWAEIVAVVGAAHAEVVHES